MLKNEVSKAGSHAIFDHLILICQQKTERDLCKVLAFIKNPIREYVAQQNETVCIFDIAV